MIDQYGRNIQYLRISITDRCNLRCKYCMPQGVTPVTHAEVLRYEEILILAEAFAALGIRHMRVTGGEPLVRAGAAGFIALLKKLPGVETVTLTSNGILLAQEADALRAAGLDGVNISLNTINEGLYESISGVAHAMPDALTGIEAMLCRGIPVKLNAVLLQETAAEIPALLRFAERGIPLRLIELMPLGAGKNMRGICAEEALLLLRQQYPDLHPVEERLGSGPAHYYRSAKLSAPVGLIDARSNRFCGSCNRVRLTSTGVLKPCLCFAEGVDLGGLLRGGAPLAALQEAIAAAVLQKKKQHCFEETQRMTERRRMHQIGG